ncbi:MAG: response regulator transcription factor [Planctomycetota bacterium]|jgi:FixJ family two-component response regulator
MSDAATVFVVDDDAGVLNALRRLIGSVGLDVETFDSAQAFLDQYDPRRPGCLVLDVRMPAFGGLELQERLLKDEMVGPPVILITGHGDVPMCARAMKSGAIDFLQKPFNDQDLLDAINRALKQDAEVRNKQAKTREILKRINLLTPRERQVLAGVAAGQTNKHVAAELGTSEKTIKVHRARVMQKMKAHSLAELVLLAHAADLNTIRK